MAYAERYFCKNCGLEVDEGDINCPKCKSFLAANNAVEVKKVLIDETKEKAKDTIYPYDNAKMSLFSPTELDLFKEHSLKSSFPSWLTVVLHIVTFGIFSVIYFGFTHGKLPKISSSDPSPAKAILFFLIPLYNIYWTFFFWVRLVERINLQYSIRLKKPPIPVSLVYISLIIALIPVPFVSLIGLWIFMSVLVSQIQSAINGLVAE